MSKKTHRFLSVLAVVIMLICVLTITAYAEETTYVADVGGTKYATIDEAIANWGANSKLTLLSDVTLSDTIKLKSTEHHYLELSTFTMTAASGKPAIEIVAYGTGSSQQGALTITADATNPGGINGGNKACIYYKYSAGQTSGDDRPIIYIKGGVFTGPTSSFVWGSNQAGIFAIGSAARKCATFDISGGTFNCSVILNSKAKLIVRGGTFNYTVSCQGDSTADRVISGGRFKTIGFMTADADTKFAIGSAKQVYDKGVYVDDEGYIVIGGPVITEAGTQFEASSTNYSGASSYLKYSSVGVGGNPLFYTSAEEALADNKSGKVTLYTDNIDLSGSSFKGDILLPAGTDDFTVTFAEGTSPVWDVVSADAAFASVYTESVSGGTVTRTYTLIAAPVITVPTANTLTYSGSELELISAGSITGGTYKLLYALGTSATAEPTDGWAESVPTSMDAGTYYVWYKTDMATDEPAYAPKAITVTIAKADQSVPVAPVTAEVWPYSIELEAVTGCEYSIDGTVWQDAPLFEGLSRGTSYTVYQRIKGDANHNPSAATSLAVVTPDACIITLDYGELGIEKRLVPYGEAADLHCPAFDGYIFMGLYADSAYTAKFDNEALITEDKTVYVKLVNYAGDKAALEAEIATAKAALQAQIDAVVAAQNSTAAELATAIAELAQAQADILELQGKIDDYVDADTALKTELQTYADAADALIKASVDTLKGEVDALTAALGTANSNITTNTNDITALKSDVLALENWKSAADGLISDLQTLTSTHTAEIAVLDASELTDKYNELKAAIALAETTLKDYADAQDSALKAELIQAIASAKAEAIAKAEELVTAAKAELNAAIALKADASELTDKYNELKAAIALAETTLKDYADAQDTALKAELIQAIATAKAEAVAKAEELVNAAKTELNAAIALKADASELTDKYNELKAAIALAETTLKDYADAQDTALKQALEAAINSAKSDLAALIGGVKTDLENAVADLKDEMLKADADLADEIADLADKLAKAQAALEKADADNKAELTALIATAKTELQNAINTVKTDLENAVADLKDEMLKADADLADEIADLADKLAKAQAALEKADADNKAELTALIATAKTELQDAIDKISADLTAAEKALMEAMNTGDSALSKRIDELSSELLGAEAAFEDIMAANKADLEAQIESARETLNDAIAKVQKNLDDAKAELNKAIADGDGALDKKIATLSSALDEANAALESAKKALEAADAASKSELESKISEAYASLENAIKAVQDNLDAVKTELEEKDRALSERIDKLEALIATMSVVAGVALCVAGLSLIGKKKLF